MLMKLTTTTWPMTDPLVSFEVYQMRVQELIAVLSQ